LSHINVINNIGYVRLVDTLGSDLSVVNAARVSYDKESTELSERDQKLIRFLLKENHTSPFRHAAITFEVYAPLMVARQWWKYAVASSHIDDQNGWNESSRRISLRMRYSIFQCQMNGEVLQKILSRAQESQ
jgi:thymidylate synthase (FAD)